MIMSDEQRDRLLLRMAAHQYRLGRIVLALGRDPHSSKPEEDLTALGQQQRWLSSTIEELQPSEGERRSENRMGLVGYRRFGLDGK